MNKFSWRSFFLISVCSTAFIGCTPRNGGNINEAIAFDTISVSERHVANQSTPSFDCELSVNFIYPENNPAVKASISLDSLRALFIESVLAPQYAHLPPKQALEEFKRNYITEFDASIKELIATMEPEEREEIPDYTYYLTIKDSITFNDKCLLSFQVCSERYDGGAHGSHGVFGYVVDLHTGKLVKENDFGAINYEKNMRQVLQQKIAAKNEVSTPKELEEIGYFSINDIVPNNNFTINDKGITYYFNEYEIGAYFLGVTEIFIPYDELRLYCNPDSPLSALMN